MICECLLYSICYNHYICRMQCVWTDELLFILTVNPAVISPSLTSFSDDDERKLKRGVLPKRATQIMKSWLFQHIAVCVMAVCWLVEALTLLLKALCCVMGCLLFADNWWLLFLQSVGLTLLVRCIQEHTPDKKYQPWMLSFVFLEDYWLKNCY